MSAKIKLSYTTEEELQSVIRLLSPVIKSWKVSKNQEGQYRKEYIELDVVKQVQKKRRCILI